MKTEKIIIACILFTFIMHMNNRSFSQTSVFINSVNIAPGMGIDYGGIGGRLTYLPIKYLGLFGSAGYNFVGLGYNVGATVRILPDKKFCPTFNVMYGYNAVILVVNASQYNNIYYGPSISGGIEIHFKKQTGNFLNVELIVPFRSQEFTDDLNNIRNMNPDFITEPFPIAFSIGYHFTILK